MSVYVYTSEVESIEKEAGLEAEKLQRELNSAKVSYQLSVLQLLHAGSSQFFAQFVRFLHTVFKAEAAEAKTREQASLDASAMQHSWVH